MFERGKQRAPSGVAAVPLLRTPPRPGAAALPASRGAGKAARAGSDSGTLRLLAQGSLQQARFYHPAQKRTTEKYAFLSR